MSNCGILLSLIYSLILLANIGLVINGLVTGNQIIILTGSIVVLFMAISALRIIKIVKSYPEE